MKLLSVKSTLFVGASIVVISLILKKIHHNKLIEFTHEYEKLLEAEQKFLEDLWYKEAGSTEMKQDSILTNLFIKKFITIQCTESQECIYRVKLTKAADKLIYNKNHIPV